MSDDEKFFFGLVAETELGKRATIEFFESGRQEFVEYDVSKLISSVVQRERRTIGVLSSLEVAAASANVWMLSQFEAKNLAALRKLKEEHKVEVLPFPDDVIKALRGFTKEVLEEQSATDADFKKIYEAYTAFSKDNDGWNVLSEAAYQRARNLE